MMDEIEMIQLENMVGYFEKEPKSAAKYLEEAKDLHKAYIANGGEFVEDNYNDMKAYALDGFKHFDKIVKDEIKRLPAACKKTAEFKEAQAAYKAAMAELLEAIEAFEIEIEEAIETKESVEETVVEEGIKEMELVEKAATTKFDSFDKDYLVMELRDTQAVVTGVLEGKLEPEQLIRESSNIWGIMQSIHGDVAKEILDVVDTWVREFHYGEASGEEVYEMITKILAAIVDSEPEEPTTKPSDSDIDKALITAYDVVVGTMNGAYTKSSVVFMQRELLDKARALHSHELTAAARILYKFYLGTCSGNEVRKKLIALRRGLLFGGDAGGIEYNSVPARCRTSGACN